MKRLFIFMLLGVILQSGAYAGGANQPKDLQPLEDVPPPPSSITDDSLGQEPQITIIKRGTDTIEEYRMNGELYMQKVTPRGGKSYYLVKQDQNGGWSRMDGPVESMAIPKWVLFRF